MPFMYCTDVTFSHSYKSHRIQKTVHTKAKCTKWANPGLFPWVLGDYQSQKPKAKQAGFDHELFLAFIKPLYTKN